MPTSTPPGTTTPSLAVLDDYASTSPPHLSHLSSRIPTISSYPATLSPSTPSGLSRLVARLRPYTVISTMRERTPFPRSLLSQLPRLKLLCTAGMRNASIDLDACRDLGITVAGTGASGTMVPGFDCTNEVTWSLILGLAGNDFRVKSGEEGGWQDVSAAGRVGVGLAGKTLGVVGLGRLGVQCAVTGMVGFGMEVVAWSENLSQERADEALGKRGVGRGRVKVVGSKEELLRTADVVSLHLVLGDRSRGCVGERELGWMKRSALLVNTSRGPLIEEAALVECLGRGGIRGFATDVFDVEPLPVDSLWRKMGYWGKQGRSEVLLSPHVGYVEEDVLRNMYIQTAENIEEWLAGKKLTREIKAVYNSFV